MNAEPSRLLRILESFSQQKILVVGDLVADEFVVGEISRVSREAPVLILRHRETEVVPGGGANAINNLADLDAQVFAVSAVGDDAAGRALLGYFRPKGLDLSGIQVVRGWTTTTKTRFLAGWTHTMRQQVLRVDREPARPLPGGVNADLLRKARARIRAADAMLLSDYGLGVVTPSFVRRLLGGARVRGRLPVTLDSRYALLDFRCLGITAATPNEPELEALYHTRIGTDLAKLERLGTRTLRRLGLEALLVTRGKDGMVIFERGRPPRALSIYGGDQVADVTGAGDTVIAVFTLALAADATFLEAAKLANYAGGIVVMKRGTATVTRQELEAAIRDDAAPSSVGTARQDRQRRARALTPRSRRQLQATEK